MRLVTYLDRGEISRRSHPKAEGRKKTGKRFFLDINIVIVMAAERPVVQKEANSF